jgi:hypothetical protein
MPVSMMEVGEMCMAVREWSVAVPMRMRFADHLTGVMMMLMVRVVNVAMLVTQFLVVVLVLMRFDEMQIHTNSHEGACQQ